MIPEPLLLVCLVYLRALLLWHPRDKFSCVHADEA
jgi:hypothetical protein